MDNKYKTLKPENLKVGLEYEYLCGLGKDFGKWVKSTVRDEKHLAYLKTIALSVPFRVRNDEILLDKDWMKDPKDFNNGK